MEQRMAKYLKRKQDMLRKAERQSRQQRVPDTSDKPQSNLTKTNNRVKAIPTIVNGQKDGQLTHLLESLKQC